MVGGTGRVIFNLHVGVGKSDVAKQQVVGHVFFIYHIFQCSGPPPPPPHTPFTFWPVLKL